MEKAESGTEGITSLEKGESQGNGINSLFRVLSKPDALKLFRHTSEGIKNSTYAIDELDLTPKRYYARLRELVDIGLVRKHNNAYRQTGLGRMIYDRLLPAMGKAFDARDELEFLEGLEGMEMENGLRKSILEELGIPIFEDFAKVKILGDYEALAVAVIDLYDSAEESILLASNYIDVRVMEACFRAVDRGVTNRLIVGKKSLSSKVKSLKGMLSLTFTKTIVNFASNKVNLRDFMRFIDLPYTFCIVDGHQGIIEISDALNESFIAALSINDRVVCEKLTKFFDTLWKAGETNVAFNILDSIKSS